MVSINVGKESVESIDARKRAIEFKNATDFRRLFKSMASDAASLYSATGEVRAQELAENYKLEFTKEIRDTMRMTLKQFGFTIRKTLEEKFDLLFDVETKLLEIELDFKRVESLNETTQTDAKLEKINKDYLIAAALFVANESHKQADFITETNIKEIEAAFTVSAAIYINQLNSLRQQGKINEAAALQKRQREVIAAGAKTDIIDKGAYRSQLIAEQNAGMTESWARQKEAELVNDAALVTTTDKVIQLEKSWIAILDQRTRENHVIADGQTVPVSQPFTVGGEQLQAPRLGQIPSNNLRCRCVSEHSII